MYLHCERSLDTGEEKLTTTGDSKKTLSYVSAWQLQTGRLEAVMHALVQTAGI